MRRLIFPVFLLFCFLFQSLIYGEESFRYENLTILKNPSETPKNLISGFVPEGSKVLYSTDLKKFGFESVETSVIFESLLSGVELLAYYEILLKSLDWKILQMEKKDSLSFILAELRMRELITISLSPKSNSTLVKIFIKKQNGY